MPPEDDRIILAVLSTKLDIISEQRREQFETIEKRLDGISHDLFILRECWQVEHDRIMTNSTRIDHLLKLEERVDDLYKRDRLTAFLAAIAGMIGAGGWRLVP